MRVVGSEGIYMVEGVVWFVVWSNSLRTRAPPLHQCCKVTSHMTGADLFVVAVLCYLIVTVIV